MTAIVKTVVETRVWPAGLWAWCGARYHIDIVNRRPNVWSAPSGSGGRLAAGFVQCCQRAPEKGWTTFHLVVMSAPCPVEYRFRIAEFRE